MGDVIYGDNIGGDKVGRDKIVYAAQQPGSRPRQKVILMMSANVDQRRPLSLDREHREVDRVVWSADSGRHLDVRIADAVQLDDLQPSLQRYKPVIAHFSGHGSAAYGIMVSDRSGRPRAVPPAALSELFGELRAGLRCVVLNACFTEEQARAIAQHVPFVIGMRGGLLDEAAIDFAAGFYRGIAHGQTIRTAFNLGRNQLRINGHLDADRPRLVAAPGVADLGVLDRPSR